MAKLAIDGGAPVRARLLPYGRQTIDDRDVAAVTGTLRSDWLTTGPKVAEFERALAAAAGTADAVAVSTGTAALHAALYAVGVGAGDEVIVTAMTFAASANAAAFLGATPVFADVRPDDLLIDPRQVEARITPRTKAIVAVDYAGQPCDYDALNAIAGKNGLALIGRRLPRDWRQLLRPARRLAGNPQRFQLSSRQTRGHGRRRRGDDGRRRARPPRAAVPQSRHHDGFPRARGSGRVRL